MSEETLRLGLPLIAANQAQKHVTHNEALFEIDALLHLHVEAKGVNTPPTSPTAGARYITGAAPTGAWAGRPATLAAWDDGAWRFITPRKGWTASVGATSDIEVFDGAAWRRAFDGDTVRGTLLAINTPPDAANPVSFRVNNILAAALPAADAGDGDIRLKLSRETATDTASLLFQSAFSGRAEMGLAGEDAFSLKVSADGAAWRQALRIEPATGEAAFPRGLAVGHRAPNLLINGDFTIRQRGGTLGAVAANALPFDRWRAGASGATVTQSGLTVTLSAGSIGQVIEPAVFGHDSLAGRRLTISVQTLTGADLGVTVAGQSATILRTSSGLSASVTVPAGSTGNITVTLAPVGGAASFRQIRIEPGDFATGWQARPLPLELALCQRYFRKSHASSVVPGGASSGALVSFSTAGGAFGVHLPLTPPMRAAPTVTLFNPVTGAAGSWRTASGGTTSPTVDVTDSGVTFSGAGAGAAVQVTGHATFDAEL